MRGESVFGSPCRKRVRQLRGEAIARTAFDKPEYRVMIVANMFQTGFDQNKLCAMYVDKRLDGVAAVQTLSRLNWYVPGNSTMVLDFANQADDILGAFSRTTRKRPSPPARVRTSSMTCRTSSTCPGSTPTRRSTRSRRSW